MTIKGRYTATLRWQRAQPFNNAPLQPLTFITMTLLPAVSETPPARRTSAPQALLLSALLLWLGGCTTTAPRPTPDPTEAPTRPAGMATEISSPPSLASASAPAVCPPCAQTTPTPVVVAPPVPAKLLEPGSWNDLPGWKEDDPTAAWPALLQSCRGMQSKPHWPQWRKVCESAATVDGQKLGEVRRFFETRFQPYRIVNADDSREGLITGYYEPLLRGNRYPSRINAHPIHAAPDDLLTIDLGEIYPELKHMRLRGRLQGNRIVPYWTRGELKKRESELNKKALAWVEDPIELFFLQVQGSGRIELPGGAVMRVGYADQNGHPYQSIGKALIEMGELRADQASMQGIQAWARANPSRVEALLNRNPSYVFFREMPSGDEGPQGALGVPLTPWRSLAIDPRSVPLGAPVYLTTTWPNSARPLQRLMLAQDTGGAIKGGVRADFFFGFGAEAGQQAGRMKQKGQMWVLLPPEASPELSSAPPTSRTKASR